MDCFQNWQARCCESIIKRGTWKVWIIRPQGSGYARGGFAWKTRLGAERFVSREYPGIQWTN